MTSKDYTTALPYAELSQTLQYSGMHAWFAGAVDTRYTVVVPIIGVQVGRGKFLSEHMGPCFHKSSANLNFL